MSNQKELLSEFSIPTYDEWRNAAVDTLKGVPFEKKLITKTYEGIELQPIYNESDRDKVAYLADSLPGNFPFTRGTCPAGYKSHSWVVSQEFSYPLPSMVNKALKEDLEQGLNGITLRVCNCNTIYEKEYAKHPEWNACICGDVQISDLKDFEDLFDGIDITKYTIQFLPTCPVAYFLEIATLFVAYCQKHNINTKDMCVNFGFGLTQYNVRNGKLDNPTEVLMDDMAALVKLCNEQGEKWSAISIDATVIHNSGAHALEEIGCAASIAVAYIKELLKRGFNIDEAAKNIHFSFSSGVRFFMEIAKLRAARVIWAKIIKEFGGNEQSQKMRIHCFTSKVDKTKYDPYVNVLRATTECLAAILAGANSITVGTFDEELGMPSGSSRRIARNVQCVLRDEAHLIDTIDPAGGAYYIEALTDQIVQGAWAIFRDIEKTGCFCDALKSGKVQEVIAAVVAKRIENISYRRDTILGTNKYPNLIEKPVADLVCVTLDAVKKHIEEVQKRKKSNDTITIWKTDWKERATKMIEAFKNGATIADLWLAKPMQVTEFKPVPAFRAAALFEGLRKASEDYKAKTGKAPQIYFEAFGTLKQSKPRADFSTDFFAVAGFEITIGKGYDTADEAIKNLAAVSAPIVVICSMDDIYPEVVPAYAKAFKEKYPKNKLIVAGNPTEYIEQFKAAGVDDFIHIKSNVYATLDGLLKFIGVM
ncbi:MAG: acyl-CoA mutase large subunit family protein [Ignavibacteria bacterium]|jgi:methylmalonyl-CoA mutase|nr:acyl-CoA mutase large subunit family protein [Ignavibacteria bacterium]